ncbi:hypothetical protein MKW98_011281 [Papaver atlanticum]|uniref:Uncharacterized protein n=1 Tax=Papaver atlanticum TaxID=357466 RepID=A0AAD4XLE8_9MAGN|nr:hypothetical protein MKW98_011281 [Papaver atlanticum]
MATACLSKEDRFREIVKMEILETKKIREKYSLDASPMSPATIWRKSISSWKLDKDEEMKLLLEIGCEPPVDHSENGIIVIENSKVKFIKGEYMSEGDRIKKLKLRKEFGKKFLAPIKDIPREEMDIEEDITAVCPTGWEEPKHTEALREMDIEEDILFDNHTAAWAKWLEDRQWVRIYPRGRSGVEAAETATDFIKKVTIEEDTEGT